MLVSSENSFVLLPDRELQNDGEDSDGPQSESHPQSHTERHVIGNTDKTLHWFHVHNGKKIRRLYLLSSFQLALEKEKEGEIEHEHKRAQTTVLKWHFTPTATKYLSLQCLWNLGGTLSLDPSALSDGTQTVLSTPEHSCKFSYGWSEAEVLTIEAYSHITGVRAPVTGSHNCPDGRRKFIFFQITGTGWHTLLL